MFQTPRSFALVALFGLTSCFGNCSRAPDPDGDGSGDDSTYGYDLIEATGEWSVSGSSKDGSCSYTTTSAKHSFNLPLPTEDAATFYSDSGLFTAFGSVNLVTEPRVGSATCSTGARACPSRPDTRGEFPSFVSIQPAAMLETNPADGVAFIPVLSTVSLPELCQSVSYDVSPAHLRGNPVTIAELKSGRFVVQGQGTVPLEPKDLNPDGTDPSELSGTLTYSFRLVFQSKTYDPAKAVAPTAFASFDECLVDSTSTEDDLDAAETAFDNGDTDIPLTANGCRRLKIVREGEKLVLSHERTLGTKLVYDAAAGKSHAERDAVTTYVWEKDAAGVRERYDTDHDGFFESTTETTFAADVWASTVTREFAPGSSAVQRQFTRSRIDELSVNVKIEENGAVLDEYVSAGKQLSCFTPTSMHAPECNGGGGGGGGPAPVCGGTTAPCTRAQRKSIRGKLNKALKKGSKCMADAGFKGFQPDEKGLTLLPTKQINLLCSTDPCDPFGYYKSQANADGKHDFMVNVAKNDAVELAKTLFHEMLHSDARFTHDDDLVSASSRACKLQLTDRTYACETMCFNPTAGGSCACSRCLNPTKGEPTKEICDKCSSFGACPGRREMRGDGTTYNVSQGIGAYCKRMKTFCDTKAECDAECAALGNTCSPVKSVCDKNCN